MQPSMILMDVALSLTGQLTVFQDIDGDIGGAYARVSLHPTGPCKIADPLNVERCRGRYRRRKDAEASRGARSCQWRIRGWATHCVQPACKSIHLQKKKKKKQDTRQWERKRASERKREGDTIKRSTHSYDIQRSLFVRASRRVR